MRKLMEHQRAVLETAGKRKLDTLVLFWQMRLGKTLATIRWMATKRDARRILLVAPLSVLEAWEAELTEEGESYAVLDAAARKKLESSCPDVRWYLVNYEALTSRRKKGENRKKAKPSLLAELNWDAVVLDESSRIRNPKADVTRVVNEHLRHARYRVLLSGLPNPEGPEDYFEQMRFAFGHLLGETNFWRFRRKHFHQAHLDRFTWVPNPRTLQSMKAEIQAKCFTLTRKQAGIRHDKIYERRMVSLPESVARQYQELERNYALGELSTKYVPVKRTWLHRIAGGFAPDFGIESEHKLAELVALLTGELRQEQVVVFFKFNLELACARKALTARGVSCDHLYGATPRSLRASKRMAFLAGKSRVMLAQTRCVRYGLDFSSADTVIYFSNWDDYEFRGQSEDRIVHPMKSSPLLYIDLITRNTVDEDIYFALRRKATTARAFESALRQHMERRLSSRGK